MHLRRKTVVYSFKKGRASCLNVRRLYWQASPYICRNVSVRKIEKRADEKNKQDERTHNVKADEQQQQQQQQQEITTGERINDACIHI